MNREDLINGLLINGINQTSEKYNLERYKKVDNNLEYLGVKLSYKNEWLITCANTCIKEKDYLKAVQRFLENVMTKNIDLARKESPLRLTYNDMIALESVFHQIDHKDDNQKYIEWLELFTLKHHFLNQDLKNYDYKDLNDEDIFNITNLDLFINQISDYARKNNYELNKMNDGDDCYYVICYNGIYYKVGVHIKQNSNNYIKRISKLDSTMVIDYKAVLENKKLIFKRK